MKEKLSFKNYPFWLRVLDFFADPIVMAVALGLVALGYLAVVVGLVIHIKTY